MKEDELRQHAECSICGHKVGEAFSPFLYRVTVEHYVLNTQAIQRQQGLTMMMGGHAGLARIMGPDEDLARKVTQGAITVCEGCSQSLETPIAQLMELALKDEEPDEEDGEGKEDEQGGDE